MYICEDIMVRVAKKEDAEIIKELCEKALGYKSEEPLISLRIKDLVGDHHYYIVVFVDDITGKTIGFMQAIRYTLLYGEDGWNVIALAVDPAAQGKGIGTKLMNSLEEHARTMGCTFIRLNSNVVRESAHAFYEHIGYIHDKTQRRYIKHI